MFGQKKLIDQNIIGLLGLESLPDEEKMAMIDKMSALVQKRIALRVMDILKDEDPAKMVELEKNPDELMKFITANVPNYSAIVEEEIVKMKQEMIDATAGVA